MLARDNGGAISLEPRTVTVNVSGDQADGAQISKLMLPANGTYKPGQHIDISAVFDRPVTVSTSAGTPSLPIALDTGSGATASYYSGSGSNTLVFRYTVRAGDNDPNGIGFGSALTLNGGLITSPDDNQAVVSNLTLPGVASTAGLLVDGINDAPEISSPPTLSASYREGDPAVTLNPDVALSDADSTSFSSATVRISAGLSTGDVLALSAEATADTGVQASWNANTATLTLTPSTAQNAPAPTLLNAQRALRAVTYASSSDNPTGTSTTRTIQWQISDSNQATSAVAVGTFTITPVNDAPTFSSLSTGVVRTQEDTAAEISFENLADVSNASDVDGQVNAYVVKALTRGSLRLGTTAQNATAWAAGSNDTITGNTKAFWTPATDVNGNGLSAFTVVARDNGPNNGLTSSTPVAVTVDVTPVADIAQITGFQLSATGTYSSGSMLKFAISLDRAISLDPTGGLPSLSLELDGNRRVDAVLQNAATNAITSYAAGDLLTFAYTVADGDLRSSSGIGLPTSLSLPDGSSFTNSDGDALNSTLPSANSSGVLVDGVRPVLATIQQAEGSQSNRGVQSFRVSFSEPVRNVDTTDFRLSATGTASGLVSAVQAVSPVNGVAAHYDVTVSDISGLGRLVLSLKETQTAISDAVGNPIGAGSVASGSIDVDRVGGIGLVAGDDRLSRAEATNVNGVKVSGTLSPAMTTTTLSNPTNPPLELWIGSTKLITITNSVVLNADGDWDGWIDPASFSALNDSTYTLDLKPAGSSSSSPALGSRVIHIDKTPPTLSDPTADPTNNPIFIGGPTLNTAEITAGFTIKGTSSAENGQGVQMRLGDINGSAVVNNGSWEASFTSTQLQSLKDGALKLALMVSDLTGNETQVDYAITLDTTAVANLKPISTDGWINIAENGQALTISGTTGGVQDGAMVNLAITSSNGGSTTTMYSSSSASVSQNGFSFNVPAQNWVHGTTYTVGVSGSDAAGNTFSDSKTVTVDTQAPDVDLHLQVGAASAVRFLDSTLAGQFAGAINTPATLNLTELASGVRIGSNSSSDAFTTNVVINNINQLVEPTLINSTRSWSVAMDPTSFALPQEGSVAVSATVTDQAGNSSRQSGTITIDRAASVEFATPVDGGSGNNILNAAEAAAVSLNGTSRGIAIGTSVSVQVLAANGTPTSVSGSTLIAANGSWSTPNVLNLSTLTDGNYSVLISATDGAGNTALNSQAFRIKTTPPLFTSTAISGDDRISAAEAAATDAPTFSGRISNAEDGQQLSITLPGVGSGVNALAARTLTTDVIDGAWQLPIPTDLLTGYAAKNGPFTANLSLTNQAGNTATTTHSFTLDTVAPVLTYTNPTDAQWGAAALDPNTTVTLTGTVQGLENGQALTVQINGRDLQATRTTNDNSNTSSWSLGLALQVLQNLRSAGNNIAIRARDLAGNLASAAQNFNATGVATTPPVILDLPANRQINADEGDLLIRQFKANQAVTWSLENVDPNLLRINPTTGGFSFFKPLAITDTNPNNLAADNRNLSFTLVATDSRNNQRRESLTLLVNNVADISIDYSDQDGISASVEAVASNGRSAPGDLNNDGIGDRFQYNVAAVPWISKQNFQAAQANPLAAAPNSFAALESGTDVRIAHVDVRKPEDLAVSGNGSSALPAVINGSTVSHPYDPLVFRLESYDPLSDQVLDAFVDRAPNVPGTQVRQTITLPGNGLRINTYIKWNPSANNGAGAWYEFLADGNPNTYDNGAELIDTNSDGLIDQIQITYTDGDPAAGDIDGLENGIIDDPGMPALLSSQSVIARGGQGGSAPASQYLPTTPPSLDLNISLEPEIENINSFFDLQLLRDFTTETLPLTNNGNRIANRRLSYYATGGGTTIPLTYNPITRRGARFYDTSGDGVADTVSLTLANGKPGDFSPLNTTVRSISRAEITDISPVFSTTNNQQLLVADPAALTTPASLRLKASLTNRTSTANQIGFLVFDDGENADAILGDLDQVRARAQTLFTTLEASDVTLPGAITFDREIPLVNNQRIQFFEVVDGTLDALPNLADIRFRLIGLRLLLGNTAEFSSSSGVNFRLDLLSGDQGLEQMIGNDQGLAPVLNFSGFTSGQKVVGSVVMGREAAFDSITGFYRTVNSEGWVRDTSNNIVRPGEEGYAAAALRSGNLVTELANLSVDNRQTSQRDIVISGETSYLAPFARVNGNTFFAYAAANSDGYAHFRSLGNNVFGLEDLVSGGDQDHDDLVFGFRFTQVIN